MDGTAATKPGSVYQEYRRHLLDTRAVPAVRVGALVVLTTNLAFVWLDHHTYPDLFWNFFAARMALNIVLLVISAWACHRFPEGSQVALGAATGLLLLHVIHGAGALGGYYVGLLLLFSGLPMLLPLSTGQNLAICGGLVFGYAALATAGGPVDWNQFAINLLFLASAAFISVLNCLQLNRSRLRDFIQRRQIERARDELAELDVAKSRFTANIHHELRTPLTLTLAPVEAMLGGEFGEVSELQRGYLKTIRSNGLRLLKLINNLLDLAKIESEQLEVKRRPVRVGEVVEEIVSGAVPLAERKQVALTTEGLADLPIIHADPEALEKVIVNLLGNALKFTDAGESITVSGTPCDEGVHLVVADTGIGIPEDQLGRIFDRFAQVDGSSTRRHEGTGIGLSLVTELVDLHGGRIWAESAGLGHGAQMHVVLPVGESDIEGEEALDDVVIDTSSSEASGRSLAAMGAELELEEDDESFGDDLRLAELQRNVERSEGGAEMPDGAPPAGVDPDAPEVVVVDDNPDMRRLLRFLVGQEYRVRTAKNGREGLEQVRARRPDLVLTDVMMPEMTGTELCAAIKGDPDLAAIPVVLVTSKAEREMKIEGLEIGADDYVTKPFHPRELMARVRSLVKLRRVQQELAVRNALLESTNEELRSTMQELREAGAQLVKAERLAAVGELAAGVAHEVNNPVNFALNAMKTLQSYVGDVQEVTSRVASLDLQDRAALDAHLAEIAALRRDLDFENVSEALGELGDIVAEGLERTSRLVGDLRDFAAPGDRGSTEIDVARGLESTLQLMGHGLSGAGIEVRTALGESLPPVLGDARALNQVFLNLLKNAAEAFEGRAGRIDVRAFREGSWILVEIQDDGPGVAPDTEARIFEPFFTTKEAGQGSGLGLSITQRIVNEHDGRIEWLRPETGGSCFRIHLPVAGAETTEATQTADGATSTPEERPSGEASGAA
ncbi:MAG: ATP-binding protein [Myxococcota bacterium]